MKLDNETMDEYLAYIESDGYRHFVRGLEENGCDDDEIDNILNQLSQYEKMLNEAENELLDYIESVVGKSISFK